MALDPRTRATVTTHGRRVLVSYARRLAFSLTERQAIQLAEAIHRALGERDLARLLGRVGPGKTLRQPPAVRTVRTSLLSDQQQAAIATALRDPIPD